MYYVLVVGYYIGYYHGYWILRCWILRDGLCPDASLADLNNQSSTKPAGGSCTAAAFLRVSVAR